MPIIDQIKKLKEKSKKRNFNQRYDLIINLKNLNLKKPDNKIDEIFVLPNGTGKTPSITFFSDSIKKMESCRIIKGSEIEGLSENKKALRKTISETDFFLSEPKLMTVVGKHLGKFLAPIGKMPKPVVSDVDKMIKDYEKGVRIETKKQLVMHLTVGSENMKEEDVAKNIEAILSFLKKRLPKGKNNIKNVFLKLTMSHPVRLEV